MCNPQNLYKTNKQTKICRCNYFRTHTDSTTVPVLSQLFHLTAFCAKCVQKLLRCSNPNTANHELPSEKLHCNPENSCITLVMNHHKEGRREKCSHQPWQTPDAAEGCLSTGQKFSCSSTGKKTVNYPVRNQNGLRAHFLSQQLQ